MINNPFTVERYVLDTRQQELEREIAQNRRARIAEECNERKSVVQRLLEIVGWRRATERRYLARREAECVCGCA